MTRIDALQIIDTELERWGYSVKQLPRYFTLETCLRIVGAE